MFRSETLHLVSKLQHYKILKILEEKFSRPTLTSGLGRPVRLRILPFDQCELIFHFRQFWKVVDLIVERPEYLQELKNQSQLILICSVSFLFVVCRLHGRHSITGNVLQLGEVAEIEAQKFGFAQKFNRRTDVEISTEPAILPNCCYSQYFLLYYIQKVLEHFRKFKSN